jgi:hypothetical protein
MPQEKKQAILVPLWSSFLGRLQKCPELPHAVEAGRTTVESVAHEILAEWQAKEEEEAWFVDLMGGKKKLAGDRGWHFRLWEDRDARRVVPLVLREWFKLVLKWERRDGREHQVGVKKSEGLWSPGQPVTHGQYLEASMLALDLM